MKGNTDILIIDELHQIAPEIDVYTGCDIPDIYTYYHPHNTKIKVLAVIYPTLENEIKNIILLANKHKIPLFVVSSGNNWGYGVATPPSDGYLILDLSKMNKISSFDSKSGLVVLQPGVTFGQLATYIKDNNLPFIAPLTGMGYEGSVIANALERGRGISGHQDRSDSVMALKVVLPDGSEFSSPFKEGFYKNGIGPNLDGLFFQSNLGVVVEAIVSLKRMPNYACGFMVKVSSTDLANLFKIKSFIEDRASLPIVSLKIFNATKASMVSGKKNHFTNQWLLVGVLQGEKAIVLPSKDIIRNIAFEMGCIPNFFSINKILFHEKIISSLPNFTRKNDLLSTLYFKKQIIYNSLGVFLPAKNSFMSYGFLHNINLTPHEHMVKFKYRNIFFTTAIFSRYNKDLPNFLIAVENIYLKHKKEPILNLFSFSEHSVYVPISVYIKENEDFDISSFKEEVSSLIKKFEGYIQRYNSIDSQRMEEHKNYINLAKSIKRTLDKNNILMPKRYISLESLE